MDPWHRVRFPHETPIAWMIRRIAYLRPACHGAIDPGPRRVAMTPHSQGELTQTLFEESADALLLFELDTRQIVNVNSMAERLSGLAREELLQIPVGDLLASENAVE